MATRDAVVDPVLLRHGYTTADLDVLTRKAAWWTPWRHLRFGERSDIARFAIVEHILAAADRPDFLSLVSVGEWAIDRHVVAEGRQRGWYVSGGRPGTPMTRYFGYWHGATRLCLPLEDRVVDRLALRQIWPLLTRAQRAALRALAEHGDCDKAAAELGITRDTLLTHQYAARKRFLMWWHEHEKPSHIWGHNVPRDPSKYPNYRGVAAGIFRRRERRARRLAAKAAAHDAPNTHPTASS
jgi:DNA-binding CsgD family transcriptional regulator